MTSREEQPSGFEPTHGDVAKSDDESRNRLSTSFCRLAAFVLALCIILQVIYVQTLQFQFLNYDDNVYVENNDHVKRGLTKSDLDWALLQPTRRTGTHSLGFRICSTSSVMDCRNQAGII